MTEISTALTDNPYFQQEVEPEVLVDNPAEDDSQDSAIEPESVEEDSTETEETIPQSNEIEIEGLGKVKPEDIVEWQKGYLRQSDYTKKTTEIARQREETAVAVELFEYLQGNPQLVEILKAAEQDPNLRSIVTAPSQEAGMMRGIMYQQLSDQLDKQVAEIKLKYNDPNLDEVTLYNTAAQMNVKDLDFVYKAMKFNSAPNESVLKEQAKKELQAELEKNKHITKTIVTPTSNKQQPKVVLTDREKSVAKGMGLSEEEYLKWR